MPGYNPREDAKDNDSGAEFLDDMLDDMEDDLEEEETRQASSGRGRSGDYLRKIEQLREERALRDHLADYDWDDI
ncbi:MAG: hypothetical protein R3208_04830 [Ketobacteraceae bacterium]|nr:hypothetical protein [Ketobacteraceae bacterium]